MANLYTGTENKMRQEIARLRSVVRELQDRLNDGRTYLMTVNQSDINVEDTLEAFGWTRSGFERE